jgi:hypothetical protein
LVSDDIVIGMIKEELENNKECKGGYVFQAPRVERDSVIQADTCLLQLHPRRLPAHRPSSRGPGQDAAGSQPGPAARRRAED